MLSSMENYKLGKQLGQAAQSTIYLAEDLKNGNKQCVLKKVECFDESEANSAFRESLVLQDLNHPYVAGYKEFFVMWAKEDSSMYMCIVMDYFPKGHLGDYINAKRQNKEVIEEETIKTWIGQIIEALVYAHEKGIIHRDVKTSNVYINEDDNLVLGDFAVASVMGDTRTCTRSTIDITNFMDPEVSGQFTQASDVWALGCILLELTTTSLYTKEQIMEKIKEIKEDPFIMEEVFEEISKFYSGEIITLIRNTLKRKNRPTARELQDKNKYVQECVKKSDASQLEKRRRRESIKRERTEVPKGQGVYKVVQYLANMVDYEDCVQSALEYLVELAKENDTFEVDASGKRMIKAAMRNNLLDKDIQIAGFNILNSLIITAQTDDIIFTPEIISIIPIAMEHHVSSAELQQAGAALLMALASQDAAVEVIGLYGGIEHIITAMKAHPNNPELCATCCHALWSLATVEDNVRIATEQKALHHVCAAMKTHMNSPDVAEAAAAAIMSLTLNDENIDSVCDLECVGLLVSAIEKHMKTSAKVVKNSCLALASLVEPSEESAYNVLVTNRIPDGGQVAGVPVILQAYDIHKDNAEVVESIVTLVMELSEYDDVCAEMKHLNVGPNLLSQIFKRFKENRDIMDPCEKALGKLQGQKIKA